jgi:hypothetical protein
MIVAQEFDHPPWITHPIVSKALEKVIMSPASIKLVYHLMTIAIPGGSVRAML